MPYGKSYLQKPSRGSRSCWRTAGQGRRLKARLVVGKGGVRHGPTHIQLQATVGLSGVNPNSFLILSSLLVLR